MFQQLKVYENIIIGLITVVFVAGLYFYICSLKTQIKDLKESLRDNQVALANYKLESTRYKNEVDNQNKEVELLRLNEKLSLAKLAKWKNKSADIKYKTIYKIREVHSNECEAIKKQLDNIKLIDFSSL